MIFRSSGSDVVDVVCFAGPPEVADLRSEPSGELEKSKVDGYLRTFVRGLVRLHRRVVDVIKRLTVSTACLRAFRPLQLQPINLVVYQGSLEAQGLVHQ